MSNTKHTPGPWAISWSTFDDGESHGIYADSGPCFSCVSYGSFLDIKTESEAEANAKLIAAAPELLEQLTELVRHIQTLPSSEGLPILNIILAKSIQVIKKATL